MPVTLASLFDGIGGGPLSASMCGAVPVWASEIEPFPIRVTEIRFPGMKHYGDITRIDGSAVEPVDIVIGGSPCQDLSIAGKRAGLAGGRSVLFMEQVRIIKEMRSAHGADKPRFMVWENVPGDFSSNGGEDFRAVLEETARIADPTVSIPRSVSGWATAGSILGDGWSISWRTIDAQYWGVPQRRRRIYLVADFGGQTAPEILFECQSVPWDFAESRSKGQGIAEDAERRTRTAGGSDVTSTLFAAYGTKWNGNSGAVTGDHFVLDDAERCVNSAGFKGNQGSKAGGIGFEAECAPTVLAGQEGHVVCFEPGAITRAMGIRHWEEISPTLRAEAFDNRPAICYGISAYESNSMKSSNPHSGIYIANTARTIDQNGGNPACNQVPLVMAHGQANAEIVQDMGPTLNCNHEQPIVAAVDCRNGTENPDINGTLQAKPNGGTSYNLQNTVRQHQSIRRLTPLECERLQGFPDGWTDIPGASDTDRYKALGNSFAVPCAYFVVSGCVEVLTQSAE